MLKKRFRDERKRILSPTLSQGEGEGSDGKCEPHRQVRVARVGASRTVNEEWTKNGRRMDEEWTKNERRMNEE